MRTILLLALGLCVPWCASGSVDLLSGPYTNGVSNCPGSGCAKGDYRYGSNATVSTNSYTLTTPTGNFTSSDVGKHGVAMDWGGTAVACGGTWTGYGCYRAVACQFTVSTVNSSTSITVSAIDTAYYCGASGIGFTSSGAAYWAVYTDDTSAIQTAVNAASGSTLTVPASYKGGVYATGGVAVPSNTTISCSTGGTFYTPRLDTIHNTYVFQFFAATGGTINGCAFEGTQNPAGAYYDLYREANVVIAVFGEDKVTITNNTFKNIWGTYVVGTSPGSNINISNNTFQNNAYYGVQLNNSGGTNPGSFIQNNTFIDTSAAIEDSSSVCQANPNSCTANVTQLWKNNNVYVGNSGGNGYYRSQSATSQHAYATVWLDCGTSASGGQPAPTEYNGVTCDSNHIHGLNSALFPTVGTEYPTAYGEVMTNNVCDQGCNGSSITGPSITTTSLPGATVNVSYSATLAATGGTTPYSWSISSGALPTGLSLTSTTGRISGTPTATGTSNFTVVVTDAGSSTASKALSITVSSSGPSITYVQSAQNGTAGTGGTSASVSLTGTAAGNFLVVEVVNGDDVVSSVTDTQSNIFTKAVSLKSTNGGQQSAEIWYAQNIVGGNDTITVTGGSGTGYIWFSALEYSGIVTSGALDKVVSAQGTGQTANSGSTATTAQANELVIGIADWYGCTPAGVATAGTSFTSRQTSSCRNDSDEGIAEDQIVSSTGTYSITATGANTSDTTWVSVGATFKAYIAPLSVTTSSLPNGTQAISYSATLAATGGTPGYTWSIFSGSLPAGLSLASSTGVISGTPTVAGTSNFTVVVTDSTSATASKALSIVISAPAPIAYVQSANNGTNGDGTTGTSATASLTGTTAGNLLVVEISNGDDVVSNVTDSQGNIFTKAVGMKVGNQDVEIWYSANIIGGSDTVTVTGAPSTGYIWFSVMEYSGIRTASPLDQTVSTSGTGQAATSANFTITTGNQLIVGIVDWLGCTTAGVGTAGSGYISRQTASCRNASDESIAEDRITSVTGTYNVTATGANISDTTWISEGATFKGAAVPPPPTPAALFAVPRVL